MSNDPKLNGQNGWSGKFDLEERTAKFGEEVIILCRDLPKDDVTRPIINQLVKCGTAVGANYCEADDAETRKDFKHKIGICKKESREAKHFLRMAAVAVPNMELRIKKLWHEARELNLIFNSIFKKL
ncbi:MAG: four helix bundle protein [Candidatus Doudnabacteria bacterium RIFCSPHIGHO2_12_FULL_48_11]|nr:MAG: four helix bundle protein [Candidatus Doudnabacteria bacterium RIFCSPHIGHO2_12_FULL_48_11]